MNRCPLKSLLATPEGKNLFARYLDAVAEAQRLYLDGDGIAMSHADTHRSRLHTQVLAAAGCCEPSTRTNCKGMPCGERCVKVALAELMMIEKNPTEEAA